jgi:hypothetical protein
MLPNRSLSLLLNLALSGGSAAAMGSGHVLPGMNAFVAGKARPRRGERTVNSTDLEENQVECGMATSLSRVKTRLLPPLCPAGSAVLP